MTLFNTKLLFKSKKKEIGLIPTHSKYKTTKLFNCFVSVSACSFCWSLFSLFPSIFFLFFVSVEIEWDDNFRCRLVVNYVVSLFCLFVGWFSSFSFHSFVLCFSTDWMIWLFERNDIDATLSQYRARERKSVVQLDKKNTNGNNKDENAVGRLSRCVWFCYTIEIITTAWKTRSGELGRERERARSNAFVPRQCPDWLMMEFLALFYSIHIFVFFFLYLNLFIIIIIFPFFTDCHRYSFCSLLDVHHRVDSHYRVMAIQQAPVMLLYSPHCVRTWLCVCVCIERKIIHIWYDVSIIQQKRTAILLLSIYWYIEADGVAME